MKTAARSRNMNRKRQYLYTGRGINKKGKQKLLAFNSFWREFIYSKKLHLFSCSLSLDIIKEADKRKMD